jgi:predicted ester cyclase
VNINSLSEIYRSYIACLNAQDWSMLSRFVDDQVCYNGKKIGVAGYRAMLEKDFREIPDLHFDIHLLVCEPPIIASRLQFECTPVGTFMGLPVNGRRIAFTENVFYEFYQQKIQRVWSVIDKAAIELQLASLE